MTNLERNQIFSWLIGDLQGDNLGPFLLRIVFILAVIFEYRIYLLFLSICRTKYISTSAFENGCLLVSQRRQVKGLTRLRICVRILAVSPDTSLFAQSMTEHKCKYRNLEISNPTG